MTRATGGSAPAATSTRSSPFLNANSSASVVASDPDLSAVLVHETHARDADLLVDPLLRACAERPAR